MILSVTVYLVYFSTPKHEVRNSAYRRKLGVFVTSLCM